MLQAVPCIVAPSEGEALCAALNKLQKADLLWTNDVVDAFMFGAHTVVRACSRSKDDGVTTQAALCYKTPSTSELACVTLPLMAQFFACMVRPGCSAYTAIDSYTCKLMFRSSMI
jgi:hypothetical protein